MGATICVVSIGDPGGGGKEDVQVLLPPYVDSCCLVGAACVGLVASLLALKAAAALL